MNIQPVHYDNIPANFFEFFVIFTKKSQIYDFTLRIAFFTIFMVF